MKPTLWALIGALAMPLGASAFDMRLNGFMSIAGGMTLADDQTLVIDPVNLATYDNDLNFATDSLVAIQAIAEVNDRMTATAQMVGRGGEDFNTQFEWAYLTYEATDSLDVKGGRLRMPLFYYSNFLELGYGYQWWIPEGKQGEFLAVGVYNQFIYVNPTTHTVIVKHSANPGFTTDSDLGTTEMFLALCRAVVQ